MSEFRVVAIVLLLVLFQSSSPPGGLRVGTVYNENFPALEIVVESSGPVIAPKLTLIEDGQATVAAGGVRPFKETGRGMAVMLALDVSGTMAGQPINDLKRALATFLDQAGPQDRVAIVSFADDLRVEVPFGSSPEKLKAAVNALATRGRITELYKGLRQSLQLFDPADLPACKRLIVISDGFDEGKACNLDDVIEEAQRRILPVDAVGLTKVDPKYLSNLNRLADKTGGIYERAENSEKLEGTFRQGIERLQSMPVAVFTAGKLQADGQEHQLGVRLESGGRMVTADTKLILNKRPSVPAATVSTQGGGWWAKLPKWVWAVTAAGLVGLGLLMVLLRRKRARVAPALVAPQAFVSPVSKPAADPLIVQPSPYDLPPLAEQPASEPPSVFDPRAPRLDESEFGTRKLPGTTIDSVQQAGQQFLQQAEPQTRVRRKTQIRTEFSPPAAGRPSAVLQAEEGLRAGATFAIEQSPFWIGSDAANQLSVEGDSYLSGFHACLEYRDGTLLLHDNNSTNGTFLNGEPVKETPRSLGYGDRIKAGRSIFQLVRG